MCEKEKYHGLLEDLVGDLLDRNQIREIYQTVGNLPQLEIKLSVSGESLGEKKSIYFSPSQGKAYDLQEDDEFILKVEMVRGTHKNSQIKRFKDNKAYAPKYPKAKDENWIIILGVDCEENEEASSGELVGLKRVNNLQTRQISTLSFKTPSIKDLKKNCFELTVFIMSDVYMGLDQQFEIKFNLLPKTEKVETESI